MDFPLNTPWRRKTLTDTLIRAEESSRGSASPEKGLTTEGWRWYILCSEHVCGRLSWLWTDMGGCIPLWEAPFLIINLNLNITESKQAASLTASAPSSCFFPPVLPSLGDRPHRSISHCSPSLANFCQSDVLHNRREFRTTRLSKVRNSKVYNFSTDTTDNIFIKLELINL